MYNTEVLKLWVALALSLGRGPFRDPKNEKRKKEKTRPTIINYFNLKQLNFTQYEPI